MPKASGGRSSGTFEKNMINLQFTVDRDDLRAFSRAFYDHSPTVQTSLRRSQWIFPIIMAVASSYFFFRHGGAAPIIFFAAGLLWFLFYPAYFRRHVVRATEKLLKEGSHEKSLGEYTLSLDEDGLHSLSPTGESKYKWDAVDRMLLTDSHLHIYLVGLSGYPIPRSMIDDAKIEEAKAFIESKTNK